MKPLFSIVVPVYNVKDYLNRCMQSLAKQDTHSVEIIFVDDGSKDESGQICDQFATEYDNVKVYHKKNGGLASARNFGLQFCSGEYVAFVDSDDYVSDDYAAKIVEQIRQHPDIDIIGFSYAKVCAGIRIYEENLRYSNKYLDEREIKTDFLPHAVCAEDVFGKRHLQLSAWAYAYRLEMISCNRILFKSEREVVNEDYLFNFEVFSKAKSIYIMPNILYLYDMREGSLTHQYHPHMYDTKKNLYHCCLELFENVGLADGLMNSLKGFWMVCMYECILEVVGDYAPYGFFEKRKKLKLLLEDELLAQSIEEYPKDKLNTKGRLLTFLCRHKILSGFILGYKIIGIIRKIGRKK